IVSMLDDAIADFGITSLDSIPPQLVYRVFSRFNRILITSKEHPLARKAEISLEDLAQYPLIVPSAESQTRKLIDRVFESHGLTYSTAMEVTGRDAIKTYVGMNLGISVMNEYFVSAEDRQRLFVRDFSHAFGKAETGIVYRKGRSLPYPAQELISML